MITDEMRILAHRVETARKLDKIIATNTARSIAHLWSDGRVVYEFASTGKVTRAAEIVAEIDHDIAWLLSLNGRHSEPNGPEDIPMLQALRAYIQVHRPEEMSLVEAVNRLRRCVDDLSGADLETFEGNEAATDLLYHARLVVANWEN